MPDKDRFAFGRNWLAFVKTLDQQRIDQAVESLKSMLLVETLAGKRFLDLGCGSGLFSLAAHQLGAEVVSMDYDPDSVACAHELKARYGRDGSSWQVVSGSILDEPFLLSLGPADVVYCWGVVHHTGNMMRAIQLACDRVSPGGTLFLAVYNDQGGASRRWLAIKRTYHRLPAYLNKTWVFLIAAYYELKFALVRLLQGRNPLPFAEWRRKRKDRGMSVWHDWVDWVGGLPFEVAKPEQIIVPLLQQGFVLQNLRTVGGGWGCNEYVFRLQALPESSRLAADAAESSAMNPSRSFGDTT
jgi:2-polyprenyl-6-hydroxyphenyl methylase/3-demethylubiquinone-9 3-methyltransferase